MLNCAFKLLPQLSMLGKCLPSSKVLVQHLVQKLMRHAGLQLAMNGMTTVMGGMQILLDSVVLHVCCNGLLLAGMTCWTRTIVLIGIP